MACFAGPAHSRSPKKTAPKPAAARPQPRRIRPSQQAALWDVLQLRAAEQAAADPAQAPAAPSRGGLPAPLKAGVERLSGFLMDDVRVHRDSAEPAKLGALAYTKGSDIHLGPGQEEHLPHEAWHVVQQKQGRVPATTQLKGVELNEDAGLEGEADRMASAIESADPPATAPHAGSASNASAVVQRKIKHKGVWLRSYDEDKSPYSKTVQSYHDAAEKYVMSDDCTTNDRTIHLLDKEGIYIFPEVHGKPADKAWARIVKGWNHTSKLSEGSWSIPIYSNPQHEELFRSIQGNPDLRGVKKSDYNTKIAGTPLKYVAGNTPFEDLHARTLTISVVLFNWLNLICSKDDREGLSKRRYFNILEDAAQKIEEMEENIAFLEDYMAGRAGINKKVPFPALDAKFTHFYTKVVTEYKPKVKTLRQALKLLAIAVKYQDPDSTVRKQDLGKSKATYLETLADEKTRGFLPSLSKDLMGLLEMKDDPSKADDDFDRTAKLLSPASKEPNEEVYKATSSVREAGMIASIKMAERPVLIKVGLAHEPALLKEFGTDAISLPQDELPRLTRKRRPKKSD